MTQRVGVVIATRNRADSLVRTIARLVALPERPPIVVVDNASTDDTRERVRSRYPAVRLVMLPRNAGVGARTIGARALDTPYVAFSDDDSWWEPGALDRAAAAFDAHPRLGLIAARILVGPRNRLDRTCGEMDASPLPADPAAPGRAVLGFIACGAVVRREALLGIGGFEARFGIGAEEQLVALDLASAGWKLSYLPEVVAHHDPVPGPRPGRRARVLRNRLWSTWLRRPLARATAITFRELVAGRGATPAALAGALRGLPWVMRERAVLPLEVEQRVRRLESH